ncbi:MAG: YggS family pyridoxal phosphate-dependent enzyme [Gammaproteobacteria bacterium]|nr:MAG: YggS family pyridoxal phosphate-dependent enzyme [Gammaproteobacteria bacterium]
MTTNPLIERLLAVRQRIRQAEQDHGRPSASVRLLAVSKTRSVDDILTAASAGQHCFGENYLQEALQKITKINNIRTSDKNRHEDPGPVEWHFIGHVQSNKTSELARHFDWLHTVDRLRIAQRLSDQRADHLMPLNLTIQVMIDRETGKSGIDAAELAELASAIIELPRLRLRGLMTIPAPQSDFTAQRRPFHVLAQLQQSLIEQGIPLDTLSMGMSGDMQAAIAEGATMVRIGSDIFGPRAPL